MIHMLALVICCLSLSWISVLVRFWVKIFMIGRVRWDDWILLMGVILFSAQCSCVLVLINATPHEHSATAREIVLYMFIVSYQISLLASVCVKTSFALSLNRCFAERWQRLLTTNMTLSFCIYATIRIFMDLFFFCGSPSGMSRKGGLRECQHYSGMVKWWLVGSIFNAVVTWVYVLLPAVVIWTSRLSFKVKASVSIITAVGVLSGLAATFRILGAGTFSTFKNLDPTNLDIIACIVVEIAFGIIATSMTNSTKLPSMLARTRSNDAGIDAVAGSSYLESGTTDFIKLSPIIGPQKLVGDTRRSLHTLKEFPALEEETFAPATPATKAERDSWDRTFGSPEIPATPARLTLIIDDISDDEDGIIGLPETKKTFTNV